MLVQIIPKNNRTKNRTKEHGDVMKLLKRGSWEGQNAMLVESLNKTWDGGRDTWAGWITEDEASFTLLNEEV